MEFLSLGLEVVLSLQLLNDHGPRRGGSDPARFLQLFLQVRVVETLPDRLHRSDQGAFRKVGGRFRLVFAPVDREHVDDVSLLEDRQRLGGVLVFGFGVVSLGLLRRAFFRNALLHLLIERLPSLHDDHSSAGREGFVPEGEFHDRFVVFVHREELRDVALGDEAVELLLAVRQLRPVDRVCDRDDPVVRRHLLVVEDGTLEVGVGLLHGPGGRGEGLRNRGEHARGFRVLGFGKVGGVRSRVARHLVLFVERLTARECFFCREAVETVRLSLNVGERIDLGRMDTLSLRFRGEDRRCLFLGELFDQGAAQGNVEKKFAFLVHPGLAGLGLPLCAECRAVFGEIRRDREIGLWNEVPHGVVAPRDHGKGRGLHAPDRDEAARAREGVGAREIHAEKPVRSRACPGRVAHAGVALVFLERGESLLDGGGVDRRHPEALHGLSHAEVLEDFVDEELPLAVRVARVHDDGRGADQLSDDGELALDALLLSHERFPLGRDHGEVAKAPHLLAAFGGRNVVGEIGVGLGLLEQMSEAPGDGRAVSADEEAVFPADDAEPLRDGAAERRLFGDVERSGGGFGHAERRKGRKRRGKV